MRYCFRIYRLNLYEEDGIVILSSQRSFKRIVSVKVKVGDLRVGNIVWMDGYIATVLSINPKADGYDVYFKIPQSLPLADFYLSKWIDKKAEVLLVSYP